MPTPISALGRIAGKKERIVLGVMSGTSVDSVDVAVCRISGAGMSSRVKLIHLHSHPYPSALQQAVRGSLRLSTPQIAELHGKLGELFGAACLRALNRAGVSSNKVDLIGSHGQTVYHHSGRSYRCTLQLGDADRLAELVGAAVFHDFRSRDIAAGGEGAPLTPYADAILFASAAGRTRTAVLNLGGIANITLIDRDPRRIVGFDTGPANAPLDRMARLLTRGRLGYDRNGALARRGKVDEGLLKRLLSADAFLRRRPPKSAGMELYGDEFVARVVRQHGRADTNLMATLTELVAQSVALAIRKHLKGRRTPRCLIVAGGGARNSFLISRLKAALPEVKIVSSDAFGVPVSAREAMAFAVLANEALFGHPIALPNVTGAKRAVLSGKLAFGRR